jgi:hypothetical protein
MPAVGSGLTAGVTTVGFIGSGRGGTVARLAVAAGYDVVLSNSRGPQTLTDLVAHLRPASRCSLRLVEQLGRARQVSEYREFGAGGQCVGFQVADGAVGKCFPDKAYRVSRPSTVDRNAGVDERGEGPPAGRVGNVGHAGDPGGPRPPQLVPTVVAG